MFDQEIKAAQEKLHKLGAVAKELAVKAAQDSTQEEAFQKAFGEFKAAKQEADSLASKREAVEEYERATKPAAENQLRRLGLDPKSEGTKELHRETFARYMKGGLSAASEYLHKVEAPREAFALLGTQDDLGGFLVPEDFRTEIVKDMAGYAVVRSAGARVVPTSKSQLVFPSIKRSTGSYPNVYSSNVAGNWRTEGAQGTDGSAPGRQNQPTFGQERIPVHIWQPDAIVLTEEFLEDAAVPVEAILAELIAEVKALDEDSAFLNGDGVVKPLGIQNAGITTVNSGNASALTYGGLVDLYSALPQQYRGGACFVMSSSTYGELLKLNTGTGGVYVFPPNSLPGTLMGKQVYFSEFMPAVSASAEPIIFGDFKHFVIAERTDMRLKRLVERFAPNVGILATARVGGQVVRTNAFRIQTVAS